MACIRGWELAGSTLLFAGRVKGGAVFAGALFDLLVGFVRKIRRAHHELVNLVGFVVGDVKLEVPGGVAGTAAGWGLGEPGLVLRTEHLDECEAVADAEIPGFGEAVIGQAMDEG